MQTSDQAHWTLSGMPGPRRTSPGTAGSDACPQSSGGENVQTRHHKGPLESEGNSEMRETGRSLTLAEVSELGGLVPDTERTARGQCTAVLTPQNQPGHTRLR